tara:strand:+ start:2450 stop:2608 length:159 start_codon:yes stop_codon:yes gene_type:complete
MGREGRCAKPRAFRIFEDGHCTKPNGTRGRIALSGVDLRDRPLSGAPVGGLQ